MKAFKHMTALVLALVMAAALAVTAYPVMLTEGKLVNVTSYDGADDTVVTIGDSGTASAAVTENTVTLKLADSYTGETVYIISDPAEEVVIDGENATPRLTSASRTCVYTLPDGQRFVKLYYGTVAISVGGLL